MLIKYDEDLIWPDTIKPVSKYLNFIKYISLLKRQALFFCRLDKLKDKYEGVTTRINIIKRKEWYESKRDHAQKGNNFPKTKTEIKKAIKEYCEQEKGFKSICCVNCWNKSENESINLWKEYSDTETGVMIKSSISRIVKSLKKSVEDIYISEIHYIDYNTEYIKKDNFFSTSIRKHLPYRFEDEIRIFTIVKEERPFKHDWTKEEIPEGIYINVDIKELIDEIIVGPFSPNWFIDIVKDVSCKYGLDKKIRKSEIGILG